MLKEPDKPWKLFSRGAIKGLTAMFSRTGGVISTKSNERTVCYLNFIT